MRCERIGHLLREQLAWVFKQEVQDLRLKAIEVTRVLVSQDLSRAHIYFIVSNDVQARSVEKLLKKANTYLRYQLTQRMELRRMPTLHFIWDDAWVRGEQMWDVLDSLRTETEL